MAKKSLKKGLFVTFEGPEGCGKTTHANHIYKYLKKEGYPVIFTREPGGTFVGEEIREILLNPRHKSITSLTELLLFEANRTQIIKEVISPALKKKKIVICDRFNDSTIVYQGYAGTLPLKEVIAIDAVVIRSAKPNLTIMLDVNAKTGLKRATKFRRKDRMESKSLAFHKRVRNGFRDLAKKDKRRIRLIKVRKSVKETQDIVRNEIVNLIRRYTKWHLPI
ncbi:MAG: dTMP kinase [Candidatus Omnitrophica bacterium]|nr:dTMP kinase [Candidatus Omnitrophota bacterium]